MENKKVSLPNELIEKYLYMKIKDENSNRSILSTLEDRSSYILRCEKYYKKSTQEHVNIMKSNGFEGSPDEREWYRVALHLYKEGHLIGLDFS